MDPEPDIAVALARDLDDLEQGLDRGDGDLRGELSALWRDFRLAVGSALGLSITVRTDIHPVIVITQSNGDLDPDQIGSWLTMPMAPLTRLSADWSISYYAERPGALFAFGADLADAVGVALGPDAFDQPPGLRTISSGVTGMASFATINRAIGILIEQGHTLDSARAHFSSDCRRSENVVAAVELISAATTAAEAP